MKDFSRSKINLEQSSGNILIYVLGSIFLLGLLIVALKGSFQEGAGIDPEKNAILVTKVQAYGAELERAVRRIVQENGYSERDIRFGTETDTGYGLVTDIPARQVFSIDGGAAEYKTPAAGVQVTPTNWIFNAVNAVPQVGTHCAMAPCSELIAFLPDVTKEFCLQLNTALGITNPSGNPPKESGNIGLHSPFMGSFTFNDDLNVTGGYLDGRLEGCFEGNGGGSTTGLAGKYYYYRVLLAR